MPNYTPSAEIVRGSRWPPAEGQITVNLTHPSAWPAGAAAWTWTLLLSPLQLGGLPEVEITATSATLAGAVMTLEFAASSAETALLAGTDKRTVKVDVKSDDGALGVDIYDVVEGTAKVRSATGEAP